MNKGITSNKRNKGLKIALSALLLFLAVLTGCVGETPAEAGYVQNEADNPLNVDIGGIVEVDFTDGDEVIILAQDNGDYYSPIIDATTSAFVFIDAEHYEIHEGDTFTIIETIDLGNGAVRDILVVTPDTTKWAHLVWEIEHELETSIQFYQNTTYTNNGTIITAFNRNGNSTNNSTTLIYHTPTITNVGDLLATIQQGDGKKAGGSDRESNEFILKQNSAYLIRITNLTVNNNLIFTKLNWYEHTNKLP